MRIEMRKTGFLLRVRECLLDLLQEAFEPILGSEGKPSPAYAGGWDRGPSRFDACLSTADESDARRDSVGGGLPAEQTGSAAEVAAEARIATPSVDELFRKYSPSLYWVCMKYTKNKEDAEDMVNQVFIKVQQHLGAFKGQSSVYTWMYRIAANECIQMLRKRKFEVDGNSVEGLEDRLQVNPEHEIDTRLILQRMMAKSDPETVEILFLLYLEGLTQEEVVGRLGISRATVNRKVNAFKALMEAYR